MPDVLLCVSPSSSSSGPALCLLPRICGGGLDVDDTVASGKPAREIEERLDTDSGGFGAGSGGSCGGTEPSGRRAVLEDANGGWVGELSEADGIWIEASLGVWSATAIEIGSAGPMSVPAED